VCGLTVKGEAYCWGTVYGELGTGFAEESTDSPAKVVSDVSGRAAGCLPLPSIMACADGFKDRASG
jgi:hypothetical protein